MLNSADRDYHEERARAELDLAYRAEHKSVAEAHFRLSAMHMERVRALTTGRPPLSLVPAGEPTQQH
jgi:hypothetical protein